MNDSTELKSFRDNFYRNLCEVPSQYDKVIDWIMENNPAADKQGYSSPEDFACHAVHSVIRGVVFGNNTYCTTGMACAFHAAHIKDKRMVILTIWL